jgi:integrase
MGAKSYVGKSGETLWLAEAYSRSRDFPGIKVEKEKKGFLSEREALVVFKQLQRECERGVLKKEAQGSSWGAVVEDFEKYLGSPKAASLHETTREDYVATIRKHTPAWWSRSAAGVTQIDVKELMNGLEAEGLSASHRRKMKVVINRIFQYGMEKRMIKGIIQSPTIGLKLEREKDTVHEILTLGEIRKLLLSARTMQHKWYYHWALALLTGMRSGELYALLWTDIDWENNAITVSKTYDSRHKVIKMQPKSGCWRTVPISSELKSLLLELKAQAGDRPNVLHRIWTWTLGLQAGELRKFCIGLGLPSIRFHTLRACFATQLIRNGVPPIQIQKICGWQDLKTMQRYIRMAGIEIQGATEGLKVLPEPEVMAKVVNLFTHESVSPIME